MTQTCQHCGRQRATGTGGGATGTGGGATTEEEAGLRPRRGRGLGRQVSLVRKAFRSNAIFFCFFFFKRTCSGKDARVGNGSRFCGAERADLSRTTPSLLLHNHHSKSNHDSCSHKKRQSSAKTPRNARLHVHWSGLSTLPFDVLESPSEKRNVSIRRGFFPTLV